jgi:hypothetical protein
MEAVWRSVRGRRTPRSNAPKILSAATKENLTANDVKKRFGVTPVTYSQWRKKEGLVGRRGRRPSLISQVGADSAIAAQVRTGVQNKVRNVLPGTRARRGHELPQRAVLGRESEGGEGLAEGLSPNCMRSLRGR